MHSLQEFLKENREEILKLSEEKTKRLAGLRAISEQLKRGLPLFYDQLIKFLEKRKGGHPQEEIVADAAGHGKELLELGYSLSHVVHAYGAMCQAITEHATMKNAQISSAEFNILNGCLDVAIASAVSEFQFRSHAASEARENEHLGFLAHELRNALSSAAIAHDMIKEGVVGVGGSTSKVLESNLRYMRTLIDRSLSEVRMRAGADLFIEKFRLMDLVDQVFFTARSDARNRGQSLVMDLDSSLEIEADRHFIMSAVSNLVQNALKYSKADAVITLRARESDDRVVIEVEDECGGIDKDKVSSLFEPYVMDHADRSGLGLGLAISQKAINLNKGNITVKNIPGTGCVFIIDIPKVLIVDPSSKLTVSGKDSVQPNIRK